VVVEVLKRVVESRIEKLAFKLNCILSEVDEMSIDKLDEILTSYVLDVNKIKMINEIISSTAQQSTEPNAPSETLDG